MKILSPKNIVAQRKKAQDTISSVEFSNVDLDRLFIPEQHTQLYYTKIYSELSKEQKLRYNQLFGARINEQFMLFESGFTNRVMRNILSNNVLEGQSDLHQCLEILLSDEDKHFKMFKLLNKACLPEFYQDNNYYFVKMSWFEQVLISIVSRYPQHIISLLWLVLLMEEYAVKFSADIISYNENEDFGELEKNFSLAHTLHLKDEAKHVHIDANLIDFVMEKSSLRKKSVNITLLNVLLKVVLRPKHAGANVINQLVDEFPSLSGKSKRLKGAISDFSYDPVMQKMLDDNSKTPLTAALLELYPEFDNAFAL